MTEVIETPQAWPAWQKILFRFFFIYLILQVAPWTWVVRIPYGFSVVQYYYSAVDWLVQIANDKLFHVRPVLVQVNGSGDTSWAWTQLWLYMLLALIGCLIWTLIDRKRPSYSAADYWLRTFLRYFVALNCFSYGIIKLFALQMFFPNISQLATPLGDLLPMRLSWLFMGYSTSYQMFTGAMETAAGLLLLNRKTVTLGLLFGAGVFANVFTMNLSYDIPVKLYSGHLLFYCVFMLSYDVPRLFNFFILNKETAGTSLYDFSYQRKFMRIGRWAGKIIFIGMAVLFQFYNSYNYYQSSHNEPELKPIKAGLYEVDTFILNGDTIPPLLTDTVRWRDMVFERGGRGSVNSLDTIFWQRYRRGYFIYKPDTATQTIQMTRRIVTGAESPICVARYEMLQNQGIKLWAKVRNDSVHVVLFPSRRHFQLAERQFHWLSEWNR